MVYKYYLEQSRTSFKKEVKVKAAPEIIAHFVLI